MHAKNMKIYGQTPSILSYATTQSFIGKDHTRNNDHSIDTSSLFRPNIDEQF
jgi:hypothetical protein